MQKPKNIVAFFFYRGKVYYFLLLDTLIFDQHMIFFSEFFLWIFISMIFNFKKYEILVDQSKSILMLLMSLNMSK